MTVSTWADLCHVEHFPCCSDIELVFRGHSIRRVFVNNRHVAWSAPSLEYARLWALCHRTDEFEGVTGNKQTSVHLQLDNGNPHYPKSLIGRQIRQKERTVSDQVIRARLMCC